MMEVESLTRSRDCSCGFVTVFRVMNEVFRYQLDTSAYDVAVRFAVREALFAASKELLLEEEVVFLASFCASLAPIHAKSWLDEETRFDENPQGSKGVVVGALRSALTAPTSPDH